MDNPSEVQEFGAHLRHLLNNPLDLRDRALTRYELLALNLIEMGYRKLP